MSCEENEQKGLEDIEEWCKSRDGIQKLIQWGAMCHKEDKSMDIQHSIICAADMEVPPTLDFACNTAVTNHFVKSKEGVHCQVTEKVLQGMTGEAVKTTELIDIYVMQCSKDGHKRVS